MQERRQFPVNADRVACDLVKWSLVHRHVSTVSVWQVTIEI